MPSLFHRVPHGELPLAAGDGATAVAARSNRRRLLVFLVVFLATLVPGLLWNFLRPAEYRASARIEITPGSVTPAAVSNRAPTVTVATDPQGQHADILAQVQVLTSRGLLEEVQRRLGGAHEPMSSKDALTDLQDSLSVEPIAGTDVVELHVVGSMPQRLPPILNTLIEAYRDRLMASHDSASQTAIDNLGKEVARLTDDIDQKRTQLASFRVRNGVVSSERSENEALARIKGLTDSLNKANEDLAKAEARVRALQDSASSGRTSGSSRDHPTEAAIEQRISATREQLRDMERNYTPEFMAMDPTARALRARLAELQQQLITARSSDQQAALVSAQEDASSARVTVERLRNQIGAQRQEAENFSGRFLQAQAMEADVAGLESARRDAMERLANLEASAGARSPDLRVLEVAAVPQEPFRPHYLRDATINLIASFALGLLAMWFIELFNRQPARAATANTILVAQPWTAPAAAVGMLPTSTPPALASSANALPGQLPAPNQSRELSQDEIASLLAAAGEEERTLCAALLSGLTVNELAALACRDLDADDASLNVRGPSARRLKLPAWLAQALASRTIGRSDEPLFGHMDGRPVTESEVAARLRCTTLDAGLPDALSITASDLRHTFVAWLVRQNVRFSDLHRLVGELSAEQLAAYAAVKPAGTVEVSSDFVPIMPALRTSP